MNYISVINSFWDAAALNPLSAGQVSLYFALLHVCNRNRWEEWFQAPNQVLSVLTGLSRSGILKARKELKERGMIDFEEHGTKATAYKIMSDSTQDSVQVSTQDGVQVDATMSKITQDSKQVSVQDSKQVSSTIAKSTQVSVQDSTQNSNTLYKHKQKTETETERPPISPIERFEDFLAEYPKDSNRFMTEHEYATLLLMEKVTEDDLVQAAKNYAEACRLERKPEKYIKNTENFLRELVFDRYLPGKYKKPVQQESATEKAKNKFVEFPQRQYDYDKLEKMLLGGG